MNFTIIIPTYNAVDELAVMLRSLARNSVQKNEVIVLLDPQKNGSHNADIEALVKSHGHKLVKNERNFGPYGSWNRGAEMAANDVLCFLTDDQYMAPEWDVRIARHSTPHNVLSTQLVEPGFLRPYHTNLLQNFGFVATEFREDAFLDFVRRSGDDRVANDGFFIPTVIHKSLFGKLGRWPDQRPFPFPNDRLFRERLLKQGIEYQRVMNSFAYHFQNSSLKSRGDTASRSFLEWRNPALVPKPRSFGRKVKDKIKWHLQKMGHVTRISGYGSPKKADRRLAAKYCVGRGLEIGPGSNRFPSINTVTLDLISDFKGRVYPKPDFVGTAYDIDQFGENRFDFIINCHTLEHLVNPIKVLKGWARILTPGGILMLVLPDKRLIPHKKDNMSRPTTLDELKKRFAENWTETLDDNPDTSCLGNPANAEFDPKNGGPGWRHFNYWTSKEMRELLEYAGFDVLDVLEGPDKNDGKDELKYSYDDFTVVSRVRK